MVGTIKVGKLQAADGTGDTISIESGHKLGGAAGSITVPGTILQTVKNSVTSGNSMSSSTAAALVTLGAITTTVANSKIIVSSTVPVQLSSNSNAKALFTLRSSVDSYSAALESHPCVNYAEGSNGWKQMGNNWFTLHSPSQPAGTAITYQIWGARSGGTSGIYVLDAWGLAADHPTVMIEIAP